MKAVVYEQQGGPEVLQLKEIATPEVGAGQVRIRVTATSFNPVDTSIRSGMFPFPIALPASPGSEVSGVVDAVGEGVTSVAVGDAMIAELLPNQGGAAEYVVLPAENAVAAPKTLPLADAAGLPLVSLTAYQGLFSEGQLEKGQKVLVVGAGGSVGSIAVQLAHQAGATVIATASGDDVKRVKELGADQVIDYKQEDVAKLPALEADLVVGFAPADLSPYYKHIKSGGRIVSATSSVDDAPENTTAIRLIGQNNPQQLAELVKLVDTGQLQLSISFRGTLEDVASIHANPPHSGKAIFVIN